MRNLAIAAILTFASVPLCAAPLYMGARDADPAVPHRNAAEVAPGIRLANGSFSWEQTDLTTAGRVMGLSMRRVYRSDMDFDGSSDGPDDSDADFDGSSDGSDGSSSG